MPVPLWFDHFLLEEPCGSGGMATVYRALDQELDRAVALKIPKPAVAADALCAERFLREARTAATLNHRSVVPVYCCGVLEGHPYLVMQYMRGGTLEWKLRTYHGYLPLGSVLLWMHDVAEALENALKHGIVHHDVKPANTLLDGDGHVKIGDFGLACELGMPVGGAVNLPENRKYWFSPLYASPEKLRTGQESYAGDIYSLGASFYHLLTGTPPFYSPNFSELIQKHLHENPPSPERLRPDVPKEVSSLILWMMERDPLDRPTYRQVIAALDEVL